MKQYLVLFLFLLVFMCYLAAQKNRTVKTESLTYPHWNSTGLLNTYRLPANSEVTMKFTTQSRINTHWVCFTDASKISHVEVIERTGMNSSK